MFNKTIQGNNIIQLILLPINKKKKNELYNKWIVFTTLIIILLSITT